MSIRDEFESVILDSMFSYFLQFSPSNCWLSIAFITQCPEVSFSRPLFLLLSVAEPTFFGEDLSFGWVDEILLANSTRY